MIICYADIKIHTCPSASLESVLGPGKTSQKEKMCLAGWVGVRQQQIWVVHAEKDFGVENLSLDCTLEFPDEMNITDALAPFLGILYNLSVMQPKHQDLKYLFCWF